MFTNQLVRCRTLLRRSLPGSLLFRFFNFDRTSLSFNDLSFGKATLSGVGKTYCNLGDFKV